MSEANRYTVTFTWAEHGKEPTVLRGWKGKSAADALCCAAEKVFPGASRRALGGLLSQDDGSGDMIRNWLIRFFENGPANVTVHQETKATPMSDFYDTQWGQRMEENELESRTITASEVAALRSVFGKVFANAEAHGWAMKRQLHDGLPSSEAIGTKLALIHSEVSEALEALRKEPLAEVLAKSASDDPNSFVAELADVVIRVGDLADDLGLDLAKAIADKHKVNLARPFRHGGKQL